MPVMILLTGSILHFVESCRNQRRSSSPQSAPLNYKNVIYIFIDLNTFRSPAVKPPCLPLMDRDTTPERLRKVRKSVSTSLSKSLTPVFDKEIADPPATSDSACHLSRILFSPSNQISDSQESGVDLAEVSAASMQGLSGQSQSSQVPVVFCPGPPIDYWAALGLKKPSVSSSAVDRKLGPRGFIVEIDAQGIERETDVPNLLFENASLIQSHEKQVAEEKAKAEADKVEAKKQKALDRKNKLAAEKKAKADVRHSSPAAEVKDLPKGEISPQGFHEGRDRKAKANAKAEAKTRAKAKASSSSSVHAPSGLHFRNIRVTKPKKGNVRTYITGLNHQGERVLITELTAKHTPHHEALMLSLKQLVETHNWSKEQAVSWRDDQKTS